MDVGDVQAAAVQVDNQEHGLLPLPKLIT